VIKYELSQSEKTDSAKQQAATQIEIAQMDESPWMENKILF
jgi:hypothetical protein